MELDRTALFDCYVVIVVRDRFAIFLDLNCLAIQNPDGDFLSTEFDGSIRRRNPPFECRLLRLVINDDFDVGFL